MRGIATSVSRRYDVGACVRGKAWLMQRALGSLAESEKWGRFVEIFWTQRASAKEKGSTGMAGVLGGVLIDEFVDKQAQELGAPGDPGFSVNRCGLGFDGSFADAAQRGHFLR